MRRFSVGVFTIMISIVFNLFSQEEIYFSPKLYNSIWPDFCFEHLEKDPKACSEHNTDNKGIDFLEFEKTGSSNAYMDEEMIHRLSAISHVIPTINSQSCFFLFCKECNSPVIRKVDWEDDDDDDDDEVSTIYYKCKCYNWTDSLGYESWKGCGKNSISSSYFDVQSKQFFHFFEQHINYCRENHLCICYWPHCSKEACEISDLVCDQINSLLDNEFFKKLKNSEFKMDFPYMKDRTNQGVLIELFIHTFFYTQYREVILRLAKWIESNQSENDKVVKDLNCLYELLDLLQLRYLNLYSLCLKKHPHPKIYYERGMILFHQGKNLESLDDIQKMISLAGERHQDLLTSDLYLKEGVVYSDLGLYDKAIIELNKAIEKNPNNKEAYFQRANAYFESGNFDQSFEDFLVSGIKSRSISSNDQLSLDFASGVASGIINGSLQAGQEFIPSLLSTTYGLGLGLWAFVNDPILVSSEFVVAAQQCIDFIKTHSTKENLLTIVPELRELIEKWDVLTPHKRGFFIGKVIGKYGIDILATMGITRGIKAYRDLKRANNLLTYESMALSERNKACIKFEAAKKAQTREEILRTANLKVQWDKQGKHIEEHNNYVAELNRSILKHDNLQKLACRFAGKGTKIGNVDPGMPGYQELVNFEEFIGYAVDEKTGKKTPTNWGKIHYAKDGVHIVPTNPRM